MRPFAALVALTIAFSGPAASLADERSAPQVMATRLLSAPQPARDPFDLAVRLRGLSPATPLVASVVPAPLVAGFTDTFWILDQRSAVLFQAIASLRLVSDHAYWFVQSDLLNRASQTDIERSADVFESRTYPLIHRYFGSEPTPGVDGDGHIVVLMANVPGVAAYFSSADTYPRAINPRSNQHDMIYVNLSALRPGDPTFDATLAHEFQHMANFAACPGQEGWVDEGASELATRIAGYDSPPPVAFVTHPDIQLTTWSTQSMELTRHYQAAYLFLRYVAERAGGWEALPDLLKTCARGEQLFADFLARDPIAPDFDSLFSDWAVANLVQDPSVADGRYAYANSTLHASIGGVASYQSPFLGSAPPYAANYIDLPADASRLTFRGDASVALLPVSADGAGMWWSNRGDNLDSRLTRRLDLRGIDRATLRFRAWYDVEDRFDFVYLSASRDGGRSWQVLPGLHTTSDQSTGNGYGPGWTAASGPDWIDEQVDLSPFGGSEILLRFEYVTDQSYNAQGFAFKDLRIPELGIDETGALDAPWTAEGWVRVDGPIPERWDLRLVRWTPGGISVERVEVDPSGTASVSLAGAASRNTLMIAAAAARTLVAADYSVSVSPSADFADGDLR